MTSRTLLLSRKQVVPILVSLLALILCSGCLRKSTAMQWPGVGEAPQQRPAGLRQVERLQGDATFLNNSSADDAAMLTQLVNEQLGSAEESLETAVALLAAGHVLDASRVLRQLDRFAPLKPQEHRKAAELWLRAGGTAEAQAHLKLALNERPDDTATMTVWAAAQVASGLPEEGLQTMLRASAAAPEAFDLRQSAALLAIGLGKSEQALPMLVELTPETAPRVHREMAALHVRDGDFRQACLRLLSILPPAEALNALGEMLADQDEWPSAYQAFQTALADAPDDPQILLNLREAGWNFPPPASIDAAPLAGGCRSFLQRVARLKAPDQGAARLAQSSLPPTAGEPSRPSLTGQSGEIVFTFSNRELSRSLFRFDDGAHNNQNAERVQATGGRNRER